MEGGQGVSARAISIRYYHEHVRSGKALTQWMRLYRAIKDQPLVTRAQLEYLTHIRLTSVCGRVRELIDAGLIGEVEGIRCPITGNMVSGLRPISQPAQQSLPGIERESMEAFA